MTWTLQFGDGEKARFLLHQCCFAPSQEPSTVSWKLSTEYAACTKNDSLLDWTGEALTTIRSEWDPASFPSYPQSKTVILAMQEQAVYDVDDDTETVDTLSRVCAWLENPNRPELMLIRFLCETMRDEWMPGGLIRDSLQVMCGIQNQDVSKLRAKK